MRYLEANSTGSFMWLIILLCWSRTEKRHPQHLKIKFMKRNRKPELVMWTNYCSMILGSVADSFFLEANFASSGWFLIWKEEDWVTAWLEEGLRPSLQNITICNDLKSSQNPPLPVQTHCSHWRLWSALCGCLLGRSVLACPFIFLFFCLLCVCMSQWKHGSFLLISFIELFNNILSPKLFF